MAPTRRPAHRDVPRGRLLARRDRAGRRPPPTRVPTSAKRSAQTSRPNSISATPGSCAAKATAGSRPALKNNSPITPRAMMRWIRKSPTAASSSPSWAQRSTPASTPPCPASPPSPAARSSPPSSRAWACGSSPAPAKANAPDKQKTPATTWGAAKHSNY